MDELELRVKEKECKETEANLHSSTSQLVELQEDIEIENDCCKKETKENVNFEKSLAFLVKNSKHSKMKEDITERTVSDESTLSVGDEEESGVCVPSETLNSEQLLQNERESGNVCNKAWWNTGIGSESQTSQTSLHHLDSKPLNDNITWKISSPEETELNSEKSEVLNEMVKKFNVKENHEEFIFKANEENQSETEPLENEKHKRKSNSGNVSSSNKFLQYSRDQLLMLMSVPASRAWPEYFDIAFKKPEGKMDLEKWVKAKQDGKFNGSATISVKIPVSSGTSNSINCSDRAPEQDAKRSKDPRERIKQELHGGLTVVLSPQRKSFSTGCHVTQQSSLNMGKTECSIDRSRELPVSRRIGSGRIARREDHEQLCQNDNRRDHRDSDKDIDQRRDGKSGWRSKTDMTSGNNRFDRDDRPHIDKRRRFFDDDDKRNERRDFRESRERRYNNNNNHRRTSVSKDIEEETPEWFTGGPSSQNEFIELVGFDEPEKDEVGKQKLENLKPKKERDVSSRKNSRSTTPVIVENMIDEIEIVKSETQMSDTAGNPIVIEPSNDQSAFQFNVEDYIGSILNFGPEEMFQCSSGGSRLKQFFNNRESPVEESVDESHSKRSSPGRDVVSQLGNLIGFAEPVIRVPSPNVGVNSSHFFTPISPADKTSGGRGTGDSLVEMLQKASASNSTTKKFPQQSVMPGSGRLPPPSVKDLLMGGKGQSVEEIEANLRRGRVPGGGQVLNMSGGHCNNTQFNQQQHHGFHTNKPPPSPLRPNQQLHSQQNPFNDMLLKNGNVSSAGPVGSKPPLLNNTTSESEFLAKLIRGGGGVGTGSGANRNNSSLLSLNVPPSRPPPPPITNLNLAPPHNLSPGNAPSLPQHSPSRSHLMPQQQQQQLQHSTASSSEVFIKIMQNQQHKKHLLHPGFPQQQQQSSHQPHLDPIKQLLGGMNNISLNSQQSQDISRDVHNLFQRVVAGQLSDSQLIAQLNSGNLTQNQREAVIAVLKLLSRHQNSPSLMPPRANLTPSPTPQAMVGGGLPLGNAPSSLSPRVASPNPEASNMLTPHMIQQARVSPLMFGRRPPSHQELVVHAQSILQKALLKNELERAKEKHRKREAAERTRSPNPPPGVSVQNGPSSVNSLSMNRSNQDCSPTKGSKCQSPLAFTPISVLRKMTAEKDRSEKDKHEGYGITDIDKVRDSQSRLPNHQNAVIHAGSVNLKNEKKNSLPTGNSMLGPRAQMVMSGAQTTSMMHINPHVISSQRHLNLPQTIPLSRNPQQNIRDTNPTLYTCSSWLHRTPESSTEKKEYRLRPFNLSVYLESIYRIFATYRKESEPCNKHTIVVSSHIKSLQRLEISIQSGPR